MKRLIYLVVLITISLAYYGVQAAQPIKGIAITSLPDNSATITVNDILPMVNAGVTKRGTISDIFSLYPGGTGGGGSMVYPGAGIPFSTGSTWGSAYTAGQGAGNLWQVPTSPGINAIWMWDNTDGTVYPVVIGANLNYSHVTHELSAAASSGMTNPMSAVGDTIYGGTAGAPSNLAKGTAYQVYIMNSGATAPAWSSILGVTGNRLTYGYFTDLAVTNAIQGNITGNAANLAFGSDAQDDVAVRGASNYGRLNITAQTVLGRITGGHLAALSTSQMKTMLGYPTSMADVVALWTTCTGYLKNDGTCDAGASASVSDTAYDATGWNGVTTVAPSKNAVRDYLESKIPGGTDGTYRLVIPSNSSIAPTAASMEIYPEANVWKMNSNGSEAIIAKTTDIPTNAAYTDINTGTDTTKFVTAAALKASYVATKDVGWAIIDSDTVTATGDGKKAYVVPASLNGMNVIGFTCSIYNLNSATGGATTMQLRRSRAGTDADVLSSALSIAYTGYTANGSINTSYDDLVAGDMLFVDIDSVTTGAAQKGLACTMTAQLP